MGLTKSGKYRKELIFEKNKKKYNRRSIVETVNSIMKTKKPLLYTCTGKLYSP